MTRAYAAGKVRRNVGESILRVITGELFSFLFSESIRCTRTELSVVIISRYM